MFVGDAAAATDPMTGEGIGQAIETGIWAAEAIHAHGEDVDAAGTSYDERLRRTMQKDHRLAGRLSGLLAHPHLAEAALRTAGASSWTRRNFVRWLFEDYPRAVLLTPTRWHTRLFSQPGAYIGNGEGGTPRSVVEIHDENASRTWPVT
jgi:flavin-dependent dehydrogenase